MAKAKKLPSGRWRIQVYHEGMKASFTADTKAEAERKGLEWQYSRSSLGNGSATLKAASKEFIHANETVLSPSTIRGYYIVLKRIENFAIADKRVENIGAQDIQRLVNYLTAKYSPKTVRNTIGFISAVLAFYAIPMPKAVNLPPAETKRYCVPTEAQIREILTLCKGEPIELAINLAAFGGLRRSEIVALTPEDIDYKTGTVNVRSAIVKGVEGELHRKGTKTASSTRTVLMPANVMQLLQGREYQLSKLTPNAITQRWRRLRKYVGTESTFHSLRHFSASLCHALQMPDQYIMGRHGWKSPATLNNIYKNEIDDFTRKMNDKVNDYINRRFS